MKPFFVIVVMTLILTASTDSHGQITVGDLYRESYAQVTNYLPPYDGISESENSQNSGAFEAHPSVFWEDGHCQTHQITEISRDGQIINISGLLQADMGRSIPGEVNVFDSRSLLFVDFETDAPFVISGNLDFQGTLHESIIYVFDEGTMSPVYYSGTYPPSGGFSAVCSGLGPFKLEIIHSFEIFQSDTGGSESAMNFNISVMPEGSVATSNESWDSLKSLFR
jgi:hypothetical protein